MVWPFGKKKQEKTPVDTVNRNYICMSLDPVNTVNDLRVGKWNMDKVQEGFAMGMLRYATQSEVDEARRIGRIE